MTKKIKFNKIFAISTSLLLGCISMVGCMKPLGKYRVTEHQDGYDINGFSEECSDKILYIPENIFGKNF